MNIKELLQKYLENQSDDFYEMENKISDYYDQILEHHELLSQLTMTSQHRILSKAIQKAKSNKNTFPYSKFIDFIIYADENQNANEIHSLLSHFSIFDFPISDIQKLRNMHDFDDRYFQQRPNELIQMILENHQLKSKICELEQRIQKISILEEINNQTNNISNIENQLNSIESNIKKITTQTSNSKIIENNIQTIQNNVDKIQQIDSSLIKEIRDISNENQANIIQYVEILHHVQAFPRIPEKPYSGILTYCKSINSLKLTSGLEVYQGALENILLSSGFYLSHDSNETNDWIEFDFDCKVVKLLSYEIQSINHIFWSLYNPISWTMLGSNDRNKWDDLDIRTNCNELREANRDSYFVCNIQSTKYYRYIRFLQTSWHDYSKHLGISRIELYGNVF